MIAHLPDYPAAVYVSQPTYAVSAQVAKDTIYMPSAIARRVLGELRSDVATATAPSPDPLSPAR